MRHSIECDYEYDPNSASSSTTLSTEETAAPVVAPKPSGNSYTFISSSQSNFAPPKRAHGSHPLSIQHNEQNSQSHQAVANRLFQFTATDMALYHHFITSKDLGASQTQMQTTQLSQLGFSFHYVLRLVLAFSGFHLARHSANHPFQGLGTDFHAVAEQHFEIAVREVTAAIPLLNTTNSPALYASTILIFVCSLAKGPQPGEYLAYRDDSGPGCLSLFMGLRSIMEICITTLQIDFSSTNAAEVQDLTSQSEEPEPPSHFEELVSHAHRDPLAQVQCLISETFPDGGLAYTDYSQVLDRLCHTYDVVFDGTSPPTESQLWPQIFGWLYTLPDTFLTDAQRRKPAALVVFAFFAVLLKRLDSAWFIRQWPEHIMNGIFHDLDERHREYVQYPMEQLR